MPQYPSEVLAVLSPHDSDVANGMIQAVGKHNCANTLALHAERVEHFVNRVRDLGKLPSEVVITVINVDDVHGALSRTC